MALPLHWIREVWFENNVFTFTPSVTNPAEFTILNGDAIAVDFLTRSWTRKCHLVEHYWLKTHDSIKAFWKRGCVGITIKSWTRSFNFFVALDVSNKRRDNTTMVKKLLLISEHKLSKLRRRHEAFIANEFVHCIPLVIGVKLWGLRSWAVEWTQPSRNPSNLPWGADSLRSFTQWTSGDFVMTYGERSSLVLSEWSCDAESEETEFSNKRWGVMPMGCLLRFLRS